MYSTLIGCFGAFWNLKLEIQNAVCALGLQAVLDNIRKTQKAYEETLTKQKKHLVYVGQTSSFKHKVSPSKCKAVKFSPAMAARQYQLYRAKTIE